MTARIGRFFVGIPLACLLMAQVVEAADLKAISFAGAYRIRIVGQLAPDDKDRLTAMFERRGGFPDSIYLESDGGDIDASMDIGRVIRRNMIPVDSLRACSGACFLAWVGGVDRIAQGTMNIRLAAENSSQARSVRAYLEEMEVPEEVIMGVLNPAAEPWTRQQIVAATGANAPSHHNWLLEQCGELTDEEVKDWESIQALKALENALASMGAGIGDNANYNIGSETQRQAARAIGFAQEHRDEIDRKYTRVTSCEKRVIADTRRQL
jgi:hypothetical protein